MQLLAHWLGSDQEKPKECRECGKAHFHRHGHYLRWIVWTLASVVDRIAVNRYLCVGCRHTTSVLPLGVISYRRLCLVLVMKHLYDREQQQWRDLLASYRRHWEKWYPQLWRGIGNFFGRLPRDAHEGWKKLGFEGVNPKLVDQVGWSLFGRYRIHTPQRIR